MNDDDACACIHNLLNSILISIRFVKDKHKY